MNMNARKRILCACDEEGFEKYDIDVYVPKEHPFARKGMHDIDIEIDCAILLKKWDISFSRKTLVEAVDDSNKLVEYLDDMLASSKIVDQHDLLGAIVTKVDMIGDDSWRIRFRMTGGKVVDMFGDDEDHFIVYETDVGDSSVG